MQARSSVKLLARLKVLPKVVRDIAGKSPLGMCQRYRHLIAAAKAKVAVAAIAREMLGFVWAIARAVTAPPTRTPLQSNIAKIARIRPVCRSGGSTQWGRRATG